MVLSEPHRQHLLAEVGEQGLDFAIEYGARTADADEVQALGFRYRGWRAGGLLLPFADGFAQLRCDEPPVGSRGDAARCVNLKGAKQQPATFGGGKPAIATEGLAAAKPLWALHWQRSEAFGEIELCIGLTVHKSQSSTFQQVFLNPDLDRNADPAERNQLAYVGISRGAKELHVIADPPAETAAHIHTITSINHKSAGAAGDV